MRRGIAGRSAALLGYADVVHRRSTAAGIARRSRGAGSSGWHFGALIFVLGR